MDWLDDTGVGGSLGHQSVAKVHEPRWPISVVLGLSGISLVVAGWSWLNNMPVAALFAYVLLLLVGCGLLWFHRFTAIGMSRQAGGTGVLVIGQAEKAALVALVVGCVGNGVVVAVWIARYFG